MPEPLVALLSALAGAVFAGGTGWIGNLEKRDKTAAVALVDLSTTVRHIDKVLQRFETKFDTMQGALHEHSTRITLLEASQRDSST